MHKEFFTNPAYIGLEKCTRVTRLPIVEYERLRYWREYYSKYSESSQREDDFTPDAHQQLSLILEEEIDISILLS
jgi:hypothetical protein